MQCRVCEFMAALASAGPSGAQVLISHGILDDLRSPMRGYLNSVQPASSGQASDWDDVEEVVDADDKFPSLPAMEAVLDFLEVGH